MKANIIILLLIFNIKVYAQDINVLRKNANRIEMEIKIKSDSLEFLKKKIKEIDNQEFYSNLSQKDFSILAVCRMDGKIKKESNPQSEVLALVFKNDTVKLTGFNNGYWIVNKGPYFGYLSELYLIENESIKKFKEILVKADEEFKKKQELEKTQKRNADELKRLAEYKKSVISKYGNEIGNKLLEGYYWIGMTDKMALISLGEPKNINTSVGSWGVHEQWVYYDLYLYFENGLLTSYQNSR